MKTIKTIKKIKKISFFLMVPVFLSSLIAGGQNQTVKELEKRLPTVSGKERVEVLNKLAYEYSDISIEKTKKYGEEALQLAKSLEDLKGEARALSNIGIVYRKAGNFKKALENGEKSIEIFETLGEKVEISRSLRQIGYVYLRSDKYDKALQTFQEALQLAEEEGGSKKLISDIMCNIAVVYRYLKHLDKKQWCQVNYLLFTTSLYSLKQPDNLP